MKILVVVLCLTTLWTVNATLRKKSPESKLQRFKSSNHEDEGYSSNRKGSMTQEDEGYSSNRKGSMTQEDEGYSSGRKMSSDYYRSNSKEKTFPPDWSNNDDSDKSDDDDSDKSDDDDSDKSDDDDSDKSDDDDSDKSDDDDADKSDDASFKSFPSGSCVCNMQSAYKVIQGESFNRSHLAIKKKTCGHMVASNLSHGAMMVYYNIDFGTKGAKAILLSMTTGTLRSLVSKEVKVVIDSPKGKVIAKFNTLSLQENCKFFELEITLTKLLTGVHDVYFVIKAHANEPKYTAMELDWFIFTDGMGLKDCKSIMPLSQNEDHRSDARKSGPGGPCVKDSDCDCSPRDCHCYKKICTIL
ncbi:hypothetical protein CHUAL_012198 [Chamberlinius hualienensis]